MFQSQAHVSVLITPLVVVAERVTPSFSRRLIEPTARKYTSCGLNPHHCGTSPRVLDRRLALEAGLSPTSCFTSLVVPENAALAHNAGTGTGWQADVVGAD